MHRQADLEVKVKMPLSARWLHIELRLRQRKRLRKKVTIDFHFRTFLASRIDSQRLSAEATCGTLGIMLNFAAQKKGQANLLPQKIYMKSASIFLSSQSSHCGYLRTWFGLAGPSRKSFTWHEIGFSHMQGGIRMFDANVKILTRGCQI